jgi:hypothetical protein
MAQSAGVVSTKLDSISEQPCSLLGTRLFFRASRCFRVSLLRSTLGLRLGRHFRMLVVLRTRCGFWMWWGFWMRCGFGMRRVLRSRLILGTRCVLRMELVLHARFALRFRRSWRMGYFGPGCRSGTLLRVWSRCIVFRSSVLGSIVLWPRSLVVVR